MDKSKLPKPSGIRPPQVRAISELPQRLTRRSKSIVVARSKPLQENGTLLSKQARRKSNSEMELKKTTNSRFLSSKTQAVSGVGAKTVSATGAIKKVTPKPAARPAVKRPATASTDSGESKPKVMKKLPDWDYKGRFFQLKDRQNDLESALRDKDQRLADLADVEESLNELKMKLEVSEKNEKHLTLENAKLKSQNESLSESLTKSEKELKTLTEKYEKLYKEHEELSERDKNNTETLNKLTKELKQLRDQHEDLTENFQNLETKHKSLNTKFKELQEEFNETAEERDSLSRKFKNEQEITRNLHDQVNLFKQDLQRSDMNRRIQHNMIQDLRGNIRVFCRIRPPIDEEEESKLQCSINIIDESGLEIRKGKESISSINGKPTDLRLEFNFDKVFGPLSTQEAIFEELAQLVQSALDGYHVCVFAYGQTGSGKTYTMQGNLEHPQKLGMIPRTIDLLFDTIKKLETIGWKYTIDTSFLEIYNENIRDLLNISSTQNFDIRFNEGKGTTVTNLTVEPMTSAGKLKKYMTLAHRNRAIAATDFNEHSSRSHAVTKIGIQGVNEEMKICYTGSINLVDLAGSESAKTSSSERIVETKNINKSLSALGSVMLALYNKDSHIPYRNSKLTYLLQPCLGGNSKTLMFVNISPFEDNYGETINSLRFASKVKEVKTGVKRNKTTLSALTPSKA